MKILIIQNSSALAQVSIGIILPSFQIYNGCLSLKASKTRQRSIKDMIVNDYEMIRLLQSEKRKI